MLEIKKQLHKLCLDFVNRRIEAIALAMEGAQEAANEETKSSSGDKYETGRAMMQQETEQNNTQLIEANKLLNALKSINVAVLQDRAEAGSLVITNNGKFYLSISAGSLKLDDEIYYAISPASPIGAKIMRQRSGFAFTLNGRSYEIMQIW
jgi:transcription elongation GreA/GreB family factor